MTGIEDLQRRVVEAEERFGLIAEQRARYSERLTDLIDAIEGRLNDQQAEIARQAAEIASQNEELTVLRQATAENKLLRGMLHTLLSAIEAGGRDVLSETMLAMEAKISALLDGGAAAVPSPEAEPAAVEDAVAEDAVAETDAQLAEPEPTEEPGEPGEVVAEEDDLGPEPEAAHAILSALDTPEQDEPAGDDGNSPEAPNIAAELAAEMAVEFEAPDDAAVSAALDEFETGDPEAETQHALAADEPDEATSAVAAPAEEDLGDTTAAEDGPAPEVLEIPAADPEVTLIDDEIIIGAAEIGATEIGPTGQDSEPAPTEGLENAEGLENLVDDERAAPDIPAVADGPDGPGGPDARPETATLEDIMRRVSKLVEEESLDPLAGDGAGVSPGAQDGNAQAPDPATVQKAASNG